MNRRNRTLIVVGLAVLLATLASYGVYRAIQSIPVREVEVAHYNVVVAKEDLKLGTAVSAQQVYLAAWPAGAPVEGGHQSIEEVVGRGLIVPVAKNEPITDSKLAAVGAGAGMAPMIAPGMRAMSVRVNDVVGVAGYVVSTSRVDVLVTVRPDKEMITRTVVSNVLVLAAGTEIDREAARTGQARQTAVVTLSVTPDDAEKIALAQSQGQIMLALRNPLDTAPAETRGVRMSGLVSAPNAEPVKQIVQGRPRMVSQAPPPPPPPYTVETIRGANRTQEVVK
jgi:pilus assembly protein CpaB